MANFFKDNPDLRFYFERGIDWQPLVELTEHGFGDPEGPKNAEEAAELYRDIAEMVGELAAEEVAPRAAAIDSQGARLEDGEAVMPSEHELIFRKIRELDLHRMCLPRELNGLNCPLLLYFATGEVLARADVSTMAHHSFHGGMALSMLSMSMLEGTTEVDDRGRIVATRFADEIEDIASGRAWGAMDITEPNAGSDMAALRTVARQDQDGTWLVTGQKIFITSGHGKYHFVIARTEGPDSGLGGLSLFLVPTYREDADGRRVRLATVDRIEEKLGHHGSVTAAISFEDTPGHLIGKRGDGFRWMLKLMNGARLGVGFETIGLCEASYRLAREYAAGRVSMGKTIDQHEMIADYLDEMASDIEGLRALAMFGAFEEELAQKKEMAARWQPAEAAEAERLGREAREHKRRARRVTPLLKYLGAEKAVEMARRSLQIHGGNGYMREFGAEKLLRDAVVMPIYEGTSQIQSLMAMKDTLTGVLRNPQGFVRRAAQVRWRALSARDPLDKRVARIQGLALSATQHLLRRTATDKVRALSGVPLGQWLGELRKSWDPKRDFSYALLHAERLCRLLADEAIAEVLWAQAQAHPDRRPVLERYLLRAEPRCRYLADTITSGDRLAFKKPSDSEESDLDPREHSEKRALA